MSQYSRRTVLKQFSATAVLGLNGCLVRDEPMAGFGLINESSREYTVAVSITSTDGDKLHDESYRVESGWSRLTREDVFESQPCRYTITVDDMITDKYDFLPSCADLEDADDHLDIVLTLSEIEYWPAKCGGG